MDTLSNFSPRSMKKSSHMTVSQSSTNNNVEPQMQHSAKEGVISSSSNRIVLVHKQHSGLRGVEEERHGHLSG